MITIKRLAEIRAFNKMSAERHTKFTGTLATEALAELLIEFDRREAETKEVLARAAESEKKRQRARQHCIQAISQILGGGDATVAADAMFNMMGLLYDEADDKQLYPPA